MISGRVPRNLPVWPVASIVVLGSMAGHASVHEPRRMEGTAFNFVVILTDDQGWGTTSTDYDPEVRESKSDFFLTPSLERLAAAGMRFTQAYAAHPNCSPTRAALQTGRSPAALHITDVIDRDRPAFYEGNRLIPPVPLRELAAEETTIPELLKSHEPAYRAAHFGKWHLGGAGPEAHGYDASDGPTMNEDGEGEGTLPDNPKRCFEITARALAWMDQQVEVARPFYLQISHYAPHLPSQARPSTLELFRERPGGARHQNVELGAMLFDLDESIGNVQDRIDQRGIAERTFLILASDNGTYPTEDTGNANGPLRGHKATAWEGGLRVPMIVRGPGIVGGSLSRVPVVTQDILPTIAELVGIPTLPPGVEGGSLAAVLRGDLDPRVRRPFAGLYFHWPHYQHTKRSKPRSTLVDGTLKLHYIWETGEVELFDLARDLAETTDISSERPESAATMKRRLLDYLGEVGAELPTPNPDYDPKRDPAKPRKEGKGASPKRRERGSGRIDDRA